MKFAVRASILLVWILAAVSLALLGLDVPMLVLSIAWILVAPWLSQRCLWFKPDVLTIREEIVAGLLVSGAVFVSAYVWSQILGLVFSLYLVIIWVLVVVLLATAWNMLTKKI